MRLERFPVMQVLRSGKALREMRMVIEPPQGGQRWFQVNARPRCRADGAVYEVIVTMLDVTQWVMDRKAAEELNARLTELTVTDSLTGLANRRGILAMADTEYARAKRRGQPLAFLMIDLDHFKRVNDTGGHAWGDDVLKRVSNAMLTGIRTDDALGRSGGEEFLAILPQTDCSGAQITAERVRAACEAAGADIGVTASIGVSCLGSTDTVDDLYRRADEAMYAAKAAGRNQVRAACLHEPLPADRPRTEIDRQLRVSTGQESDSGML